MKKKRYFIRIISMAFCLVPVLLGILLTIQLFTTQTSPLNNWQNHLFIFITYAILLCGFILSIFLVKLVQQLSSKERFTVKNLTIANRIRFCLLLITILTLGIFPKIYQLADINDAPGLLFIGMVVFLIPLFVTLLANVLIELLEQAIDLKNDYDLTV